MDDDILTPWAPAERMKSNMDDMLFEAKHLNKLPQGHREFLHWCHAVAAPKKEEKIAPRIHQEKKKTEDEEVAQELTLAGAAIMKAVVAEGDATKKRARYDDECVFHLTLRLDGAAEGDPPLSSTRVRHGGSGVPAKVVLGKGCREYRGLELALTQMLPGEHAHLKLTPEYLWEHKSAKDRGVDAPPPTVPPTASLMFEVELLAVRTVKNCGNLEMTDATVTKLVTKEGEGWETPRKPFEVRCWVEGYEPPAEGGDEGADTGARRGRVFFKRALLDYEVGAGRIPRSLEKAIDTMKIGEHARVRCERSTLRPEFDGHGTVGLVSGIPRYEDAADGVEYRVEVEYFMHVRDLFGDGKVCKKRVKEGEGEFPVDCPMTDSTVRAHYTVRTLPGRELVYDTRTDAALKGEPHEWATGNGLAPEALEQSVRLMTVKELSIVTSEPSYAYDLPGAEIARLRGAAGVPKNTAVEWEVVLESFVKTVNWHRSTFEPMLAEAQRMKDEGNQLWKAGKHTFARAKYQRVVGNLDGLRGLEPDQAEQVDSLKFSAQLNLAACLQKAEEHVECVRMLTKAMRPHPTSAKGHYRRACSHLAMHNYDEVLEDLTVCETSDASFKPDAEKMRRRVAQLRREGAEKEKALYDNKINETGLRFKDASSYGSAK